MLDTTSEVLVPIKIGYLKNLINRSKSLLPFQLNEMKHVDERTSERQIPDL